MTTATRTAGRAAVLTGALAATLAFPGVAFAGDAPGNNGTLKVHGPNTPFEVRANEPKQVCRFYLAGFGFDSNQVVNYRFNVQGGANNGDPAGNPGSFTVGPTGNNPTGDGRTPVLEPDVHGLSNGKYKVTGTTNDGSKTKVFTVECDDVPGVPTPTPTPGGGGDPDPTPGGGGDPDDGGVGGVGNPDDEGTPPVGGVATGGGGLAGATSVDVTLPLLMTAVTGLALATIPLRRRRSE